MATTRELWFYLSSTGTARNLPCAPLTAPFYMRSSCCSAARLCPPLWDPTDCSTPGFPALHYLPEFTKIYVHWIDDATQPSHPLPPPSLLAYNLPSIRVFSQWVSSNGKQTHIQMGSGQQADCPPSCDGVGWARGPSWQPPFVFLSGKHFWMAEAGCILTFKALLNWRKRKNPYPAPYETREYH